MNRCQPSSLGCYNVHMSRWHVDVVVGWVPCDSHSSLCTDASRLLLVATTFKCQDGISCLGILTTGHSMSNEQEL